MSRRSNPKKVAYWQQVIDEWKTSGESISRFCHRHKITVASFYQWRNKLAIGANRERMQFVPVELMREPVAPTNRPQFTLHYPNGCYLRLELGFEPDVIASVNKAMGV